MRGTFAKGSICERKLLRMKQCKARKGRRGDHHRTPIMPTPFAPLYSDGGGAVAAAGKYAHGGP